MWGIRQRETKVFTQTRDYTPRAYTVPQPFKLSYQNKHKTNKTLRHHETLKVEAIERELQECTFQPVTLEQQNRKLIQSLLEA